MDLQEFVAKYKGKVVDFDGAYGAQCVDLARQYMAEVWGFTKQPEAVIGASVFFFQHSQRPIQYKLCNCVPYTGAVQPPIGALLIFKSSGTNQYGHIAICLNTTSQDMTVFEQDGIANDKALEKGKRQKGAYIGTWKYDRLVGWLTKKEEG
jgi:hypothetical protein